MIFAYILSAAAFLAGLGLNITSGWLITMASFMPPVLTLNVAVVMVRFFGISRSVARYGERVIGHQSIFDKLAEIRSDLYKKITSRPLELLKANRTGQLVKQVVDDVERTQEYELRVSLPGVTALITLVAAFGLAFWLQPKIAIIWLVVIVLLGIVIPITASKALRKSSSIVEDLESTYADRIRSNSHGYLEAENYGYLDILISETNDLESNIERAEIRYFNQVRLFQIFINLIVAATLLCTISIVQLPAVQVAMLVFLALTGFEAALAWYPNLFAAGKLLNAKAKITAISETIAEDKIIVAFGEIKADNFLPYWNSPISKAVSFKLNRGDVLILRGPSGAGKTTTAMGILGFLNYEGSLTINGIELNQIENISNIAVGALQNGHIFNTSIEENLKIANKNTEKIEEVLDLLELRELINSMPHGLETVVGQFGRSLSGGEIKRLNLARALISDAPVLVLDEPLEHLDPDLAKRVEGRILEKYRDRVLIIITHSGFSGLPEQKLEQLIEN